MKAYSLDSKDSISFIWFIAISMLPYNMNRVHERAPMWVLSNYFSKSDIERTPRWSLQNRWISSHFRLSSQHRYYIPHTHAIVFRARGLFFEAFYSRPSRCRARRCHSTLMQPAIMMPQQYAEDLVSKICKLDNVFEKAKLNELFTEEGDASIRCFLRDYLTLKFDANLTKIAF